MKTLEEIDAAVAAINAEKDAIYNEREAIWELDEKLAQLDKERMQLAHPELWAKWNEVNEAGKNLEARANQVAREIRDAGLKFHPFEWR